MSVNNLHAIKECAVEMIRVAEFHDDGDDAGTSICQQNTAALFINTLISSNLNIPLSAQNSMLAACKVCYFSGGQMDAPSSMVLNLAQAFSNHVNNREEARRSIVQIVNQIQVLA
jgi:hypothetical protein